MVHNTKVTEKQPTLLIASVEEASTGKEIVHDIPTTAPLVPLDFLLVNIQGIVPQDTVIILKMGGYKVTRCVCVCTVQVAIIYIICLYIALQECNYAIWLSSAKMATIRSRGLFLQFSANRIIVSREPNSRAPCSGFSTVPIVWIAPFGLVSFLWKGLLPQQQ